MEVTTLELDLTEETTDIIVKSIHKKLRPIVDSISLTILEDAIENGSFEDIKTAIGEAIINSFFIDVINEAIAEHEFDEAD